MEEGVGAAVPVCEALCVVERDGVGRAEGVAVGDEERVPLGLCVALGLSVLEAVCEGLAPQTVHRSPLALNMRTAGSVAAPPSEPAGTSASTGDESCCRRGAGAGPATTAAPSVGVPPGGARVQSAAPVLPSRQSSAPSGAVT